MNASNNNKQVSRCIA